MGNRQIGRWKSFEIDISDSTTISDECNLGGCFEYMLLLVPTITAATITVQAAMTAGGTAYNMHLTNPADGTDNKIISDSGTGSLIWCVPIRGAQFIKVVSSQAQAADRTFYVRGIDRYVELE